MTPRPFGERCGKLLNDGRHVCLFYPGHEGDCHPHVNAPFPPIPRVDDSEEEWRRAFHRVAHLFVPLNPLVIP